MLFVSLVQFQDADHTYKVAPKTKRLFGSKKRGCPAAVNLREVILFPEYKVSVCVNRSRKAGSIVTSEMLCVIVNVELARTLRGLRCAECVSKLL